MDDSLKENIKMCIFEYTSIDKELKLLKDEIKARTEKRDELRSKLVSLMKNINVDCFEIGKEAVYYKKSKTRQCISRRYLKNVLSDNIQDADYVETLLDIIMEGRAVTEKELLVCKNLQ